MRHHRFTHPLWSNNATRLAAFGITLLGILGMTGFAENASAHGYIESPASRSYNCNLQVNKNCGNVQWDPYSVEGTKGFPQGGPADGQISSGGIPQFSELNQQSSNRWHKLNIQPGQHTFKWHLTTQHRTTKWHYYITKQGWDSSAPLTRSALDLKPFCSVNDGGKIPPKSVSHSCNVPSDRSGHHLILGVWDVHDTLGAFYQVIDVNIGGSSEAQPGQLAPDTLHRSIKANLDKAVAVATSSTSSTALVDHSSELTCSHHQTGGK
ncbi:lytic polysaccharide monooxygenase [Paenibacillus sp. 481]|uniref:lytic polysaccharide monooxygenase n=1 Tax=Paenibacillus sp. 481 TaxID=2835869 RepID=UPI001E4744CE|nr:lytic polysaccharide monooxygenase [Paenibacillus sp. 481]UHA72571.1 lytic polysaccharide monooxygenase [Paenibacillus sp. 481]